MTPEQKLTPKYWVAHDKTTDDVIPSTLAKSRDTSLMALTNEFDDWYDENRFEIILVEVKQVGI